MLYELPNGTTVKIPDEIFFKLTDEEFKDFISNASGYEIEDPFYDSVLENSLDPIILKKFDTLLDEIDEVPKELFKEDFED